MKKLLLGLLLGLFLSDASEYYFQVNYHGEDPVPVHLQVAEFMSAPFLITLYRLTAGE